MTMQDNWEEEEGQSPIVPAPVIMPSYEEVEVQPEDEPDSDEAEIRLVAELSDKDREHLFGLSGILDTGDTVEDDLSDLVDVDSDDIIEGVADEPPPKRYGVTARGRRVIRRMPPPTTMGGMR